MKIFSFGRVVGCFSFLLLGILALASPPAEKYHLLKKVPLGANRWHACVLASKSKKGGPKPALSATFTPG